MTTASDKGIDMLRVLVGGQWHHKNLNNCLKNSLKSSNKKSCGVLFSEGKNAVLLLMGWMLLYLGQVQVL